MRQLAPSPIPERWRHLALRAPADDERSNSATPGRILIVEDDYLVAIEMEGRLVEAGYEVVGTAGSAEEAISLARAHNPDLAIMDIRLAGLRDGVDAAVELFREHGTRSIFATAHDDPRTRRRAAAAEPLGWLRKPYSPDDLIAAVKAALADRN
jgi:two-component system, response regulator PdtaR